MPLKFPDILESNNTSSTGYPIIRGTQIGGQNIVENLNALYSLNEFILSPTYSHDDNPEAVYEDAIGYTVYVKSERKFYKLVDWANRKNSEGWEIASVPLNESGKIDTQYLPSYVDDVVEGYYEQNPETEEWEFWTAETPSTLIVPEKGKIYLDISTDPETGEPKNDSYRWTGESYYKVSSPIDVTEEVTEGSKAVVTSCGVYEELQDYVKKEDVVQSDWDENNTESTTHILHRTHWKHTEDFSYHFETGSPDAEHTDSADIYSDIHLTEEMVMSSVFNYTIDETEYSITLDSNNKVDDTSELTAGKWFFGEFMGIQGLVIVADNNIIVEWYGEGAYSMSGGSIQDYSFIVNLYEDNITYSYDTVSVSVDVYEKLDKRYVYTPDWDINDSESGEYIKNRTHKREFVTPQDEVVLSTGNQNEHQTLGNTSVDIFDDISFIESRAYESHIVLKDENESSIYVKESAVSALGMLGDEKAVDSLV